MVTAAVAVALLIGLLLAFDAFAQARDKGPFDPALFFTYAWVVVISMAGGLAHFYRKVRSGQTRAFNLTELVGELVTSAVAGVITFFLCRWAGVSDWAMAAFVGIVGHMGSRALFLLERVFERWAVRTFGATTNDAPVPATQGTPGDER